MTITHLSHFGLTRIATTETNVLFEGGKGACKRLAAAHGMEVERYEGAITGSDCGIGHYLPATPESFSRCFYKGGGLIQKTRDAYCLVMPKEIWEKN